MDWISTPFLILVFAGLVVFAISCAFCFMLGRLMGKMDGRDVPGQGRRTGARDRRGPVRTGPQDRGKGPAITGAQEPAKAPTIEQPSTG